MALNDSILDLAAAAITDAALFMSLHSAAPNAAGSNETTAARQSIPWSAVAGGDSTATNLAFTGGTPSGPATHVGLWSAVSGGIFYGSAALSGDQAFNAAGQYTVTTATLTGSAT